MYGKAELWPYLALWVGVLSIVFWRDWRGRQPVSGLVLIYCFQFWMFYWLGALLHAFPWTGLPDANLVLLGFRESTWALLAFTAGSFAVLLLSKAPDTRVLYVPNRALAKAYIYAGVASYFVLPPLIGWIPSFNALVAVGQQLLIVGVCLLCWTAWHEGGGRKLIRYLAVFMILPIVGVLTSGFLGYAAMALGTITMFVSWFFRPRNVLVVSLAVLAYIGLSFYVPYMQGRTEIRAAVWGGSDFLTRADAFLTAMAKARPFNIFDDSHLEPVDGRINQCGLVGAGVAHLGYTHDFVRGETIFQAMLGFIPRIIWPDKPIFAGSGNWASRFTGIEFAEGTSVGMGTVLELYGNFGTAGVIIGFFLIGILVQKLDTAAGTCLRQGNWHGFALWFLIGLAFLNLGGSLGESTAGAAASVVCAHLMNAILARYQRRRTAAPAPLFQSGAVRY
jgi:hypothetical protein